MCKNTADWKQSLLQGHVMLPGKNLQWQETNCRSWSLLPPPALQPSCSTTSRQSRKGSSCQSSPTPPSWTWKGEGCCETTASLSQYLLSNNGCSQIDAKMYHINSLNGFIYFCKTCSRLGDVSALAFTCLVGVNLPGISQSPRHLHSHSSPATFCMAWGTSLLSYLSSNMKEVDSISLKPIPIL